MSLTKDDLIEKKMKVDAELSKLKLDIAEAKRLARARGIFLPPDELREMEERRAMTAQLSQRFQREIARVNAEEKAKRMAESDAEYASKSRPARFMEAAERILTDEMFERILEEADL